MNKWFRVIWSLVLMTMSMYFINDAKLFTGLCLFSWAMNIDNSRHWEVTNER